jgi:hypothetical protein
MLPASWEEYLAKLERERKMAPNPTRRHQPRVTRMQSGRMRRVETQTANPVRAAYTPENERNQTPTKPESWRGTKNLGGSTGPKHVPGFGSKRTQSR